MTKKQRIWCSILPVFVFLLYLGMVQVMTLLMSGGVQASFMGDLAAIVIGLSLYVVLLRRRRVVHPVESFRPRAWAVLLWLLSIGMVWFITQCMAFCITLRIDDVGLAAYQTTISQDIELWILLAIFIAPVAEEVVFRFGMYLPWRNAFGGIFAVVLSSLLFAWIHGTIVHFPVGFLMGMFNVVIWEVTGEFKYPVLSHVIYNFLSVGAVIPVSQDVANGVLGSIWLNVLLGVVLFAGMIVLYVKRDAVRKFVVTPNKLDEWNRKWDE